VRRGQRLSRNFIDMTTLNTHPPATSQHGSEAIFGDNPPQYTADIGLDLVGSLAPPQSDPSSSKVHPVPDANNASGSKRKLEDRDSASDPEARAHERKKPKQESPDESMSSLIPPRHMPDIAGVESLVNICDICCQLPLLTFSTEVPLI
jgi:hypothetical protein